jgi:hypothetical protein
MEGWGEEARFRDKPTNGTTLSSSFVAGEGENLEADAQM